ncbi:unnamed protein product [Ectocarpus sp. 4 AP-2014]
MDVGTETPQLVVRPFGEGPVEGSSSAEQEYGNSNTSSNGGLSGEVQPAAISEGEDSKNRDTVSKKGLQRWLRPPSPIPGLKKKFRSKRSRGSSLDFEVLHALSGVDREGDFVLTPVGSGGKNYAGDLDTSAGTDALDDAGSAISGASVEEKGVSAEAVAANLRGGGGGEGEDHSTGKPKRAIKLARGLSNVARRLTKRSVGSSEAMSLGRDNSYVRAHDADFDGDGHGSYTGGWSNSPTSPEHGERKLPKDWHLPLTSTSPVTPPLASPPPQADQGRPPRSCPSSRRHSPTTNGEMLTPGLPPPQMPRITRGLTDPGSPCDDRRFEETVTGVGSGSRRKEDVLEKGGEGVCRAEAREQEGKPEVTRGRPGLLEGDKSKSLSPIGGWEGIGQRHRSRSASPKRVNPFNRKPVSPSGNGEDQAQDRGQDGQEGHTDQETSSFNPASPVTTTSSATPRSDEVTATQATSKAKLNAEKILYDRSRSDEVIQGHVKRSDLGHAPSVVEDVPAAPVKVPPCVPAALPPELKYGDRLRLKARVHHRPSGGSDISVGASGEGGASPPAEGVVGGGGGFVGSLEKVQKVSTKLFRRSEVAVISQSEGNNAAGFTSCHFKAVDPENKKQDGDIVRYGDVIFLVDDRNYVWSDNVRNGHLLPGSLRMKSRGSKRQIAVSFKSFLAPLKVDANNELPAVVFSTHGLQITTVEYGSKDQNIKKRRTSTRKNFHALTAFSKKNSGNPNVNGAFLCADGRGEGVLFEVHLPNESPIGDPSPVVTKVTVHVGEKPRLHHKMSFLPPLSTKVQEAHWPSETPTAPLSCVTADASCTGQRSSASGIRLEDKISQGSEKPRPKSMVSKVLPVRRKLKTAHKRRSSLSLKRPKSASVGHSRSATSGRGFMTPGSIPSPACSPTNSELSRSNLDGDDEELLLSEEGGAFSDGDTVEGLRWGDSVRFKMPDEGQEILDDKLMTLRLSNGYTATLTSEELRKHAGLGKFPVKAINMKGSQDQSGDLPSGNGLVFLKCVLAPCSCAEADDAAAPTGAASVTPLAQGEVAGLAERVYHNVSRMLFPNDGGKVDAFFSRGVDMSVVKPSALKGVLPRISRSVALFLVLAVGVLSLSTIQSSFSSWPISMSRAPRSTGKAAPSAAPSPCTSVWDIRRPDGTEYPHNQLSAAAAALAVPEEANSQDNWQQGSPEDGDRAGGNARREAAHPRGEGGNGRASPASYPGGGRAISAEDAAVTVSQTAAGPQAEADSVGVRRTLAGDGGVGGGWHARGYAQGGADAGVGMSAWVGAIGLAAVAFAVVLVKGLFGIGGTSSPPETPSPSGPMQAQVVLLGWDGRRMSEATGATEDIDTLFYPPPSGSSLAPMPHRFLLAESMDVAKAWARWEATLDWRKETEADTILDRPHPKFALIKSKYAHCFHLPDKDGRVTYYERPGMSDIAELKRLGITKSELLDHYVYCMEFLWKVLQPRQSQRITIVIDLAGVRFRDLIGESLAFLKTSVGMMSRHYPQRSFKIMILNAPSFFNSVFALVKPMLNEATKKKIDLLPVANVGEEMLKVIPSEHLPLHYGGAGEVALGSSPQELAMLAHVEKVLAENGQSMQKAS